MSRPLSLLLLCSCVMVTTSPGISAGTRPHPSSPRGGPITPHDVEWSLWDELTRRQSPPAAGLPGRGGSGWSLNMLPAARPEDPPTFRMLRRWTVAGPDPTGAPWLWLRPEITAFASASDPHRQLRPIHADVRRGEEVDPALRARVGLRASAGILSGVTAHFRLAFDSEGRNDPRNRTRDFDQLGASNNIDEAYVRWTGTALSVTLGRMPLAWGPSPHGRLLLSAAAPAVDLVHVNVKWGTRHRLQAFAGELSSESATVDGVDTHHRRYLYGHRVDLWPASWLRVGLGETAIVTGPNESLSLRYANPVQFYAQAQTEENGIDQAQVNVLDAIDAEVRRGGTQAYGSLVVDDIQIDAEGRDRAPDQLAWSVGVTSGFSVRSPWWSGYEYRRVGSWFGLHDGPGTDYRHFGRPLGAPEGPDTDRHLFFLSRWLQGSWRGRADVERRRRGENRVTTADSRIGRAGEAFPTGRVERRWTTRLSLERWIGEVSRVRAEAAFHAIEHVDNTPEGLDVWEFRLTLDWRGPAWRGRPPRFD